MPGAHFKIKAGHPACAPFPLIVRVYLSLCALDLYSGRTHSTFCTNLNLNFEH